MEKHGGEGIALAHYTPFKYTNPSGSFFISRRKVVGHESMGVYHYHTDYEIFYLLSGERLYFIVDRTYLIKQGDLVFIKPFDLHATQDTGTPDHERILIKFNRDFLLDLPERGFSAFDRLFNQYRHVQFSPLLQHTVEELFDHIQQEAQNESTDFEMYLRALLIELLITSARVLHHAAADSPINSTHARILEIIKYINGNYQNKLSLSMVAEAFHISPYYLSRTFKEVTGLAFTAYLNCLRVSLAQKLLKDLDGSIITIANEVGFENQSYFGKIFKSIVGLTPLQYRKQLEERT